MEQVITHTFSRAINFPNTTHFLSCTNKCKKIYIHLLFFRWGFTPESEAERFKHQEVLELIRKNIEKNKEDEIIIDQEIILETK